MKNILTLILLITISLTKSFAQTNSEPITTKKKGGEIQFYQGDEKLNLREVKSIFESNELAYQQIKKAKTTYTWAYISSVCGGGLIGYPLGTALAGGDPEWALLGAGVGLVTISILITRSYNKKAKLALETYNNGVQTTTYNNTQELRFLSNASGFGLTYSF